MTFEGKKLTDKWYPVRILSADCYTPKVGITGGTPVVTYGKEGTGDVAYEPSGNWVEYGSGDYWLRIGQGEYTAECKYINHVVASTFAPYDFIVEVKDGTDADAYNSLGTISAAVTSFRTVVSAGVNVSKLLGTAIKGSAGYLYAKTDGNKGLPDYLSFGYGITSILRGLGGHVAQIDSGGFHDLTHCELANAVAGKLRTGDVVYWPSMTYSVNTSFANSGISLYPAHTIITHVSGNNITFNPPHNATAGATYAGEYVMIRTPVSVLLDQYLPVIASPTAQSPHARLVALGTAGLHTLTHVSAGFLSVSAGVVAARTSVSADVIAARTSLSAGVAALELGQYRNIDGTFSYDAENFDIYANASLSSAGAVVTAGAWKARVLDYDGTQIIGSANWTSSGVNATTKVQYWHYNTSSDMSAIMAGQTMYLTLACTAGGTAYTKDIFATVTEY